LALNNREIAQIFDNIADMLEIQGEIIHRVLSYRRAAEAIRETPRDLAALAAEGELGSIPGVGKVLGEKIQELLDRGTVDLYERLKEEIPLGILEMVKVSGVGPKKAKRFWEELNITSLDALETAAKEGKLRTMSGMGAKSEARILEAIEALKRQATGRTPLGVAYPLAHDILKFLLEMPEAQDGIVAGSIRRGLPTIGDIDLMVKGDAPIPVMERFVTMANVAVVLGHGESKSSIQLHNGVQVDLRVIPSERWGTAMHHFTGSKAHNIKIRELFLARGLSMNEFALTPTDGSPEILCASEEDVFQHLGLPFIPPEIREDWGEIEAAKPNKLPNLITLDDMQADLHMHTDWSDGTATIREMAMEALKRGRKYIVITDHSRSLGVANGLSIERLMNQNVQIKQVDAEMGGEIRVFHGTEMEINADGTLDFPDDVLEKLDFVVASLHMSLRQPREQITERLLNAVTNPHVDLIGHPRGQLIPTREPADLDMDMIFAAAQKSGIALEINANPHRLDLEAQLARRAVELGIPICIDTDAHRPSEMDLMHFGITTARRGWVEAKSVINTWPVERFLEWTKGRGR
jgi:DNA polymerase (family 10)